MLKKCSFLVILVCLIAVGITFETRDAGAQGKSDSHSQVVVIQETKNDRFDQGPEEPLPPFTSQPTSHKIIALRRTHAPGLQQILRDPALQTSVGPLVSSTSGGNFLGIGEGLGNFSVYYAPPDTNGAVGKTQYVQWVNVNFAVFNKSDGSLAYGPVAGNSIWSGFGAPCENHNSGDPIAQYDKQADRWVMMQPVFTSPYTLCLAVSTTSNFTSGGITWNRYAFQVPNSSSNFPDYPKLAVWPDGYYISYNSFTNGSTWAGPEACVVDRSKMLAGASATMQCTLPLGRSFGALLPSDLDGDTGAAGSTAAPPAGAPNYYLGLYSSTQLTLFKFHVDWTTPSNSTFTGPTTIPVTSYNEACGGGTCIQQAGTNQKLDSLADRLMYRLAYRNFASASPPYESLVVAHSVDPGNGTSGIRWYEIRNPGGSPSVYQQGTFAPDSNYRWMPSIAQDKAGNIAVGYSVSSSNMHPAIRYTGRLVGDTLGTMESEAPIVDGGGSQLPNLNRWGDYSAMSVDPTDDCTFWYTNEFLMQNGTFNWSTQIASFTLAGCGGSSTGSFALTANAPTSQTVTAGNSANYSLSVDPSGGFTGNVNLSVTSSLPAGVNVGFSPNPADVTSSSSVPVTMHVTTTASTPAGTYNIDVQGTNGSLTASTSVTLVVQAASSGDFSLSSSDFTVARNTTGSTTITVTPSDGFTQSVSLSVSGTPPRTGSNISPNPVTISGTDPVNSTLSIKANRNAQTGTYPLTITGTSGSLTHQINITLTISNSSSTPSFSLSPSPTSQTVTPGDPASYSITVNPAGGFTGNVTLSVTGSLPTGVGVNFSPNPVAAGSSSAMNVTTSGSTPPGTYTIDVQGTSGSLTASTSVTLVVQSASGGGFTVSVAPSNITVQRGTTGSAYAITVTSTGYSGPVQLAVSGYPSKVTPNLSPTSVGVSSGSPGNSSLTFTADSKGPTGTYTITVTGTGSDGSTSSASSTLTVTK